MKRIRSFVLFFLSLITVVSSLTAWIVYRDQRQEQLNRSLIAAVKRNDTRAVISLLDQGADTNCHDEPYTPISWWQILKDRLHGVKPKSFIGSTPLMIALQPQFDTVGFALENQPLVKALLDHKADVNVRDADGDSLLDKAIVARQKAIIHLLLQYGADMKPTSPGEAAALASATQCISNSTDVLTDMLHRGADVNQRDRSGDTALYEAVWVQNVEAVRLLLSNHADVTVRGMGGDTLLALAKRFPITPQNQQIIRLLKQAGAKQ